MADMPTVYYHTAVITTGWIKRLGQLFLFGGSPIHTRIYWYADYSYWMTELTSDSPVAPTEVVGRGDGYMIQITRVAAPQGIPVPNCDGSKIRDLACKYGNVKNGMYNTFDCFEWYTEPQGYGGPMYDNRFTSNTYASWLMRKSCISGSAPVSPKGGLGWNSLPEFPGKKNR